MSAQDILSPHDIQAVDVHGHYGPYRRGQNQLIDRFLTLDAADVVARARLAGTRR